GLRALREPDLLRDRGLRRPGDLRARGGGDRRREHAGVLSRDPAVPARAVRAAIGGASPRLFYLETPPFLFGRVVKGLAEAGLTANARVVVEKPFGHALQPARELADELHESIDA